MQRGTWRFARPWYYVAWILLIAYYVLCLVYSAVWVLTRADTVEQLLNASLGGNFTQNEVAQATDNILEIWLTSAGFAILFTYFVTEPILIALRFVVLPACISRLGAMAKHRLDELGRSHLQGLGRSNIMAGLGKQSSILHVLEQEAGAVAATAREQAQWERSLIFILDFVSELLNNLVP